ncbi:hypothetical protein HOG21_01130 [bacterium]|nr:hypothetical protein [bacterium]
MIYYILIIFIIFAISFLILINIYKLMLIKIEKQIKNEISYKNNLISCLYEITKKDLIKHSKAFYMIIKLKQNESKQNYNNICILEKSLINKLINRELNFIFNISDKNNIIKKDKKYLYIKNYIKSKNKVIYKNIETY